MSKNIIKKAANRFRKQNSLLSRRCAIVLSIMGKAIQDKGFTEISATHALNSNRVIVKLPNNEEIVYGYSGTR